MAEIRNENTFIDHYAIYQMIEPENYTLEQNSTTHEKNLKIQHHSDVHKANAQKRTFFSLTHES